MERLQAERPAVYPDGQLRTLQRRLKEWRREAAHRMVFGTMTANPGVAPGDGEGSPLSNGANDYFSGDGDGGAKSPVDLPLRLDDAARRPQLHRANISKHRFRNQERELRLGRRIVRQREHAW